jgi:CheY-like chemotaxis protein
MTDGAPADGRPPGNRRGTLLLIEDDWEVRQALTELLEDAGYPTVIAENGLAALEQLRKGFRPGVILLDIFMPVMDGWDFRASQLRDPQLRDIPTIVLTAAGFSLESVKIQFGHVEFVPKELLPGSLLEAVARLCSPQLP